MSLDPRVRRSRRAPCGSGCARSNSSSMPGLPGHRAPPSDARAAKDVERGLVGPVEVFEHEHRVHPGKLVAQDSNTSWAPPPARGCACNAPVRVRHVDERGPSGRVNSGSQRPRERARGPRLPANARTSDVLPIPASPETSTSRPARVLASECAPGAAASASSRSRRTVVAARAEVRCSPADRRPSRRLPQPGRARIADRDEGGEPMATVEANPNLGAQIVEDAKEYVLYSWSTQDAINPIAVAGAEGRYFWDYDGKRVPRLRVPARQRQHRPPAPEDHRGDQGAGRQALHDRPADGLESRSRLGRLLEEVTPGDLCMSFFTNSGAEANENAIKLARLATGRHKIIARYRSYHGATHGSIVLTGDPRRWPNEPGMGGVVRMLDPYTYRCPAGHPDPCPGVHGRAASRGDPRVRGRAHGRCGDPRDRDRDERDHPAPTRVPAGDPRGLRPARDPADPRRGHGRASGARALVRLRELGRRPGHHHRREGHQLGLRPARRDDHPRAPEGGVGRRYFPGGLTYAGHPLAWRRQSPRSRPSRRRASSRTLPRSARISEDGLRALASATRRSARCAGSAASGASSS